MPAMATLDAPTLTPGTRTRDTRRRARHRSGRVILAVGALVLGIGSCQLPQPHLPTLRVAAVGARVSSLADADRA